MRQMPEIGVRGTNLAGETPLREQILEAVRSRTTPISQLLRLMSALDAQEGANENLRLQLRTRIGAPLGV